METRQCKFCLEEKPATMFGRFYYKMEFKDECADCRKKRITETAERKKERRKQWRQDNPEIMKERWQKYFAEHKHEIYERHKEYRQSEEGQAKNKEYRERHKEIMYHCELCDYDIKRYKKSQHEKSKNHLYFLQKSLNNEKLERPDEKEMFDGIEYFCCLKCNKKEINYNWNLHLRDEEHINKEKETKGMATLYTIMN